MEDKTIRFIDPHYKTLFHLPDGGNIIVTYDDGTQHERQCHFIDEYHTKIGSNDYHICEFAERMQQAGNTYAPKEPAADIVENYEVYQTALFSDGVGVAAAFNPDAPDPYVTWFFTEKDGERNYRVGEYRSDAVAGEKAFLLRLKHYKQDYRVNIVKREYCEKGFVMRRSVLFSDSMGFEVGQHPSRKYPFIVMRFYQRTSGERKYEWPEICTNFTDACLSLDRRADEYNVVNLRQPVEWQTGDPPGQKAQRTKAKTEKPKERG